MLALLIEQVGMGTGAQQALVSVLTVDIDQQGAQIAQLSQGGRSTVDKSPAAVVGVDGAPQDELGISTHALIIQPLPDRGSGSKNGGDFGALSALADKALLGACAQCEGQGINEDGFTSTSFSGKYAKSGVKMDMCLINNDKISYVQ